MKPFLLLYPYLRSLKNRWKSGSGFKEQWFQDLIIFGFCSFVMLLIFKGTLDTLAKVAELSEYLYLPPSHPIGLAFFLLSLMLVASSAALALGALFLGKDIELLLSCPVSVNQVATGKGLYVLVGASWMPFFFLSPFLLAFGIHHEAPWYYYPGAMLLLIPFFIIATALAVIVTTIFACLISATKTREMLLLAGTLGIVLLYLLLDLVDISRDSLSSSQELLRLVGIISMPDVQWLPSNWLATSLTSILLRDASPAWTHILLLWTVAISLTSLAYILLQFGMYRGIAQMRTLSQSSRNPIARSIPLINLLPGLSRPDRALLKKEIRLFSRDLTHVAQLVVLLLLCSFYLYNLRIFRALDTLPEGLKENWRQILFIVNVCMGSFIAIAICTRFVFPSISLEGQSYWIIRKAPLSIRNILQSKFRYWYWPVTLVTAFFFSAGAYTIGASYQLIVVHVACAAIICYGIVGVAIGCGSIFARFDWEYSTQLAASPGSLIFMLSSITLVMVNVIPGFILIALQEYNVRISPNHKILLFTASASLMVLLNVFVSRQMTKLAEQALQKRE